MEVLVNSYNDTSASLLTSEGLQATHSGSILFIEDIHTGEEKTIKKSII